MTDRCGEGCQTDDFVGKAAQKSEASQFQKPFTSIFKVPKMDCPSEERMIRLTLEGVKPSVGLTFDISKREVKVFHSSNLEQIKAKLEALGFGAKLQSTKLSCSNEVDEAFIIDRQSQSQESKTLKWLLVINAVMFIAELSIGWYAQSTGLIADSLDMFADAAVYGLALYAVGRSFRMKLNAAHLSGWLQVVLALGALSEVVRRFVYGSEPVSELMMTFGLVALFANTTCLLLIVKKKDSGAHMKASWIFSANDVIANLGVISAGALVAWTGSRYPDLIIGFIISVIVLNAAHRILKLKS